MAVYLGETGSDLCPVAAITSYVARQCELAGPFFRLQDGTPLTKAQFVSRVRGILSRVGIDTSAYTGHSFRIDAATTVFFKCAMLM